MRGLAGSVLDTKSCTGISIGDESAHSMRVCTGSIGGQKDIGDDEECGNCKEDCRHQRASLERSSVPPHVRLLALVKCHFVALFLDNAQFDRQWQRIYNAL